MIFVPLVYFRTQGEQQGGGGSYSPPAAGCDHASMEWTPLTLENTSFEITRSHLHRYIHMRYL